MEFNAIKERQLMKLDISYPRNETIQVVVDSRTTAAELLLNLGFVLKITSISGFVIYVNGWWSLFSFFLFTFSFYLFFLNVFKKGVALGEKEMLMDLIFTAEKEGSVQLYFQKQVFKPGEPRSTSLNALVFNQILEVFLNERVICPELVSLKLGVLLFLANGGSPDKLSSAQL